MSTKIKICGLKRPEDIEYVNEFKPEYVGFVFFPPSSRYVDVKTACELSAKLDKDIIPVGVFLDNTLEEILEVAESNAVSMLQFHGVTAPEIVSRIKKDKLTALPLIEAFSIKTHDDVERAVKSEADYILLDNGAGGTGSAFDWNLLGNVDRDFFIAGGLNAQNVAEVLKLNPYAVDTSSGVETQKIKDRSKIGDFINRVRMRGDKADV